MKTLVIMTSAFLTLTCLQAQESRKIGNFVSVYTGGDVRVELIHSNEPKVEFKMLKGKETDLVTEVKGGQLKIKTNSNGWGGAGAKAEVKLYYTSLEEIEVSAGSTLNTREALKSRNLEIATSSGARATLLLECQILTVNAFFGSKANLIGTVKEKGSFEASSGAGIDASGLETAKVKAEASSGSSISVWAKDSLDADSSSGGRINYKGEPKEKNLSNNISGGNIGKL
ncbi:MAG: DUF2807 domain-containing protein [Saprospiraceae bacterium]|nr:DUF2807 domain-containing protein [Saprospiraceae bacterium]